MAPRTPHCPAMNPSLLCAMAIAVLAVGCNGKPAAVAPPPREPAWLAIRSEEGPNKHAAGNWRYVLEVRATDTLAETRAGLLFKDDRAVLGATRGESITTPWGSMRWFGPPPRAIRIRLPYEFGWLSRGVYDRPLD